MARGMRIASRITGASLMLVLPVLGGYWVDLNYGIAPTGILVGGVLGFLIAGWEFYKLIEQLPRS